MTCDMSGASFNQETFEKIRQMFDYNSMNFEFLNDVYHIYNRNDDKYYDIYIKVYGDSSHIITKNVDLDIISHIVRHDDSVVSNHFVNVNTTFSEIPKYIKTL